MIRYAITLAEIRAKIVEESHDWLDRAQERTERFRALKKYDESSSIWSEIKSVYMRLQGNCKCAYCERKLEAVDYGRGEQDVEHFRPKSSIRAWKVPKALSDAGITFSSVLATGNGYYLLPYHLFNYSSSCKPCNSALKSNYFPVAGTYHPDGDDPANLQSELPYLIYPIGNIDDDPETLLMFTGLSPRPVATTGHSRNRALVTIEFFQLDAVEKRKNLYRERAMILAALYPLLVKMSGIGVTQEKVKAKAVVERFTGPDAPHTNCARSFRRLFEQKPDEAEKFYSLVLEFINSIS